MDSQGVGGRERPAARGWDRRSRAAPAGVAHTMTFARFEPAGEVNRLRTLDTAALKAADRIGGHRAHPQHDRQSQPPVISAHRWPHHEQGPSETRAHTTVTKVPPPPVLGNERMGPQVVPNSQRSRGRHWNGRATKSCPSGRLVFYNDDSRPDQTPGQFPPVNPWIGPQIVVPSFEPVPTPVR